MFTEVLKAAYVASAKKRRRKKKWGITTKLILAAIFVYAVICSAIVVCSVHPFFTQFANNVAK
jgi:hypothetical protein